MPPAALMRYELALFARSFADAFRRKRDRLLLATVVALALLWLRHATGDPDGFALPPGWELVALIAAPIAFHWNRVVIRRLDWLAEESALAHCAADGRAQRRYRLAAQLPILVPLLIEIVFLGAVGGGVAIAAGLTVAAYGLGILAASARIGRGRTGARTGRGGRSPTAPLSGSRTAFLILLRVQALNGTRPVPILVLLLAANALLTFAGASLTLGAEPGAHLAASVLPSLLLLAATGRNDAGLVGFLAFAGYRAGFVALAVSGLPGASLAAASVAVLASGTAAAGPAIAVLALLHLGAALFAIARAWLSPGRDARKVNLQVMVEAAGLLVIGSIQPVLGLVALAVRLWRLSGLYRASIWIQP
jgi:hypothetical protein